MCFPIHQKVTNKSLAACFIAYRLCVKKGKISKLVIKTERLLQEVMFRGSLFQIDGAVLIKHSAHALNVALRCSSRMPQP